MLVELNKRTIESFQLYNELMTQGGMGRQVNYMWPQGMAPAGQYMSTPMQEPAQVMSQGKDGMNPVPQMAMPPDAMMYPQMNYYGNMNPIPSQDVRHSAGYGVPQFPLNKNQPMPPHHTYPSAANIAQISQKQNFPSNGNNNAMTSLNYPDMNLR